MTSKITTLLFPFVFSVATALVSCTTDSNENERTVIGSSTNITTSPTDSILIHAFENNISDLQVTAHSVVSRILPDDTDGDKHQKFIIQLSNEQTILIAHNIDIAPRVNNLQVNDSVSLHGEYEWSDLGGTIHWTHSDPNGNHIDGWITHEGIVYQ